jgi:plasmid stabilization system protein ParE
MAFEIIWTHEALEDFRKVILYVTEVWGDDAAANFHAATFHCLDLVSEFPKIGHVSSINMHERECRIDDHNFLIYSVFENKIYVQSVFPYKRKRY